MTTHYGMIGCGMMGHEHLKNIALLDDAAVSVVYEPNKSMKESAQELVPDATFVNSLDDLLAHDALDALVITTPNFCHVQDLEAIAEKVTLPILVEKPLFTDPDDLSRIQAFKDSYGAPVWVAMEYRYMPPMQMFLDRVDAFTGGIKMFSVTEHRFPFLTKVKNWNRLNKYSGGTFVEKCCHFFDLMRLTVKSDPVRVMATGGQAVNHLSEIYDGQACDIWDCGYVIVDFANGARAMLELSMYTEGSEYQEMMHALGPKGKLEVKIPGPARLWTGDKDAPPVPHLVESPRYPCNPKKIDVPIDPTILDAGDHNGSTYYQHVKFLDVIRGSGAVEVTLDDGIWAVRMGMAAQESAVTGQVIELT